VQRSKGVSSVQFPFWQRYNPRVDKITIFRHAAHEGPGYFADFLDRKGIGHRLIRVDCDDPIPESLDGISGLVFMGGPMSVNDPLPWIPKLTRLIQQAIAADVPVLGHCLGGQLMAKALCASITRNPVKEIGWFPVTVVEICPRRSWPITGTVKRLQFQKVQRAFLRRLIARTKVSPSANIWHCSAMSK
jgi:GMP synthase-like glutamine amidotransferase